MKKAYLIFNLDTKSYYTGKKNYEWNENVFHAMVFSSKPTKRYMAQFNGQFLFLEVKTIFISKK